MSRVRSAAAWPLAVEVREHDLAALAVGQRDPRLGVDDLGQIAVLPEVQPVLLRALERDGGAVELGEAVAGEGAQAEEVLDAPAGGVGVGLGAEDGQAQAQGLRVLPGLAEGVDEPQRVRGMMCSTVVPKSFISEIGAAAARADRSSAPRAPESVRPSLPVKRP
jgi:hypothetical protein